MTLCLAVNLLYSKQKKTIKLPNWGLCFLQSLEGITGFSLAFLHLLFDLPRLPQLHILSFESVASSFVFVVFTIMLSDAMPKDLFLLNLPCSDVYIRGASALIFVTKCESETESSRGTHLQWIQTQGFFEQMFFCLCIVQILMYILVTRLCLIPNVFKYIICTMTMTICGTGIFGNSDLREWAGWLYIAFFHYRDGASRVIF